MGAGATVPASAEDALAEGYTKEEIDRYLEAHPEARRTEREVAALASTSAVVGGRTKITAAFGSDREARLRKEHQQRIMAAQALFERVGGDFDQLAVELPCTDATKMRVYVETKLKEIHEHAVAASDTAPVNMAEYSEYRQPSYVWACAHVEGVFYD